MLKHFNPIIALDVGLEEAILFQYIIELIYHAKCVPTPESMEYQGEIWIRRPCRKIQKDLSFFSCKRIYLAIDRLCESGYLQRQSITKSKWDTSYWFAIGGGR